MRKWQCSICGYVHEGDEPPEKCPVCGADKSLFTEIVAEPQVVDAPAGEEAPAAAASPPADPRAVDLGPEPSTLLGRTLQFALGQMLKHHAHPISTHFPNGILPIAFIFIILSVLMESRALETAAYCNMVFLVLVLPFVLFSGYIEWQKRYKGFRSRPFIIKIACAAIVFGLSAVVVIWWTVNPDVLRVPSSGRTLFILANLGALGAAGVAGLIGGRLVFRE